VSGIEAAIDLIEREIAVKRACCVIFDEGCPDESSLMGTRDGYLNLALTLLKLVVDSDRGGCRDVAPDCAWDDRIKDVMYQLPTHSAWLVGAYLFQSHAEFMETLSKSVDSQLKFPLLNDPQFRDPECGEGE
jgi:hypothetical protein